MTFGTDIFTSCSSNLIFYALTSTAVEAFAGRTELSNWVDIIKIKP